MISTKYIGMDVHKESISIAVRNAAGKVVMECVIETKASMILQVISGLRGDLQVTFEEGTSAAWLYDLLKPHVTKLLVCDPRKNKSMREGNQSDKIDARGLAELLRLDHLTPVYHGEHGLRTLKELVRTYLTVTKDLTRVMSRVKAIYRSWAIPCSGKQVYARRHRAEWLGKINEPGVHRRAEFYYQQLDALRVVRQEVPRPSRITRKSYGPRVPNRTMVAKWTTFCFAGFGTDRLRCEEAMKTAGRENPNRWAKLASNRAHGAAVQNRSCSIKWAGKQEKLRPMEGCFFLTSPFIELTGTYRLDERSSLENATFSEQPHDRANVRNLVNDKAANVAELDPQRIGPRFEESRGYVANLAFTSNEGCPRCERKTSVGDRAYPAPPL